MSISIGMVGLGMFGGEFVNLFKAHPLVSRIAFCDREPDRVRRYADDPFCREKFNPRDAYDSLDAICRSDLDALVIFTQPWLHAPQCIQVMESGKHVLSAVPVIHVPDDQEMLDWCDRVIAATKATGRHYMLAETSYYHPEVMFMRRQRAAGAFGRFISAESEYSHDYSGAWGVSLRRVAAKRLDSAAGREWKAVRSKYQGFKSGPMHYPTHSVSGPISIMDTYARKVSAIAMDATVYDEYHTKGALVNETAFFHLANGATLTAREYREVTGEGYEMNVYGTCAAWRGRKWLWTKRARNLPVDQVPEHGERDPTPAEMRDPLPAEVQAAIMRAQNPSLPAAQAEAMPFEPHGHYGSHPYLVHEFVSAVAAGRRPAIHAWAAARFMAMGVTAHRSALAGGTLLDIPDWGDPPAS